jgi:uncharacterized protein YeeX (DUF496 family)
VEYEYNEKSEKKQKKREMLPNNKKVMTNNKRVKTNLTALTYCRMMCVNVSDVNFLQDWYFNSDPLFNFFQMWNLI